MNGRKIGEHNHKTRVCAQINDKQSKKGPKIVRKINQNNECLSFTNLLLLDLI